MKYMDVVQTPWGPGNVIGQAEGGLAVTIRRDDLTGGRICQGPNLTLVVGWCAIHRAAYDELVGCPDCTQETANGQ